jgi:hypothetical protein
MAPAAHPERTLDTAMSVIAMVVFVLVMVCSFLVAGYLKNWSLVSTSYATIWRIDRQGHGRQLVLSQYPLLRSVSFCFTTPVLVLPGSGIGPAI